MQQLSCHCEFHRYFWIFITRNRSTNVPKEAKEEQERGSNWFLGCTAVGTRYLLNIDSNAGHGLTLQACRAVKCLSISSTPTIPAMTQQQALVIFVCWKIRQTFAKSGWTLWTRRCSLQTTACATSNTSWFQGQFGHLDFKGCVALTQVNLQISSIQIRVISTLSVDNHFYVHLTDVGNFEHVDFAVTTVHSNKPYKFGK